MSGIAYMPIGSRWAHLEVIRAYKSPAVDGAVVDLAGGPLTWVLRCDCGRKLALEAAAFPGKRKLRACGDPDCEWSKPQPKRQPGRALGRPRNHETCAALSLYLPVGVIGMIEAHSKRRGIAVSTATAELVRAGVAAMEDAPEPEAREAAAWDENTGPRGPQIP